MTQPPSRPTVIVVEDDESVRRSIQLLLHWRGFEVRSFGGVARLLGSSDLETADTLVADYRLPDGDGLGVLNALRQRRWPGRAFLITGYPSVQLEADARLCGYEAVLEKPLRQHELIGLLGR